MKPQRALIVATLFTLLVAVGAVVFAATNATPGDGNSQVSVISTQVPAAAGDDPLIKRFTVTGQSGEDDLKRADDDDEAYGQSSDDDEAYGQSNDDDEHDGDDDD